MINKVTIVLSWLLVLISMLMIFSFSSETAVTSTQTSAGVVTEVLGVVMDKEDITPAVVSKYQSPIRKMAHFGIYMLLGFCTISAFEKTFKIKLLFNTVLSFVFCIIYAFSDEFHQSFTEGRGPSFFDVLIDSSGALTGILFFLALIKIFSILAIKFKKSRA